VDIVVIGFVALLILALAGVPLGYSMMAVGFVGFGLLRGLDPAVHMVGQQILDLSTSISFSVLPLFILMGALVVRAGLAEELYSACNSWLGHMRGGLAIATVASCGGFAAVSGSSVATAATMAKVAIPSMRKFHYDDGLAAGTVAAGGTMGILIPPSAALIIYGVLIEEDIAKLFMGGIIPGLITVLLYALVIYLVAIIRPDWAPRGERAVWAERFQSLSKVWAVVVLFLLILGGIFFGVFTPTEAGGIGAVGALVFATARRRMSWRKLGESLLEAGQTTAQIFFVAFGALVLNQFLNFAGLPDAILKLLGSFDATPIAAIIIIFGFYIVLGMFVEGISMIFLTVPIFAPVVQALGFDLVWFGVVVVMVVEISLITPPIGLNVFVLKSMLPDVPLSSIYRGIMPFFVADIVRLLLVLFFPPIVLFLPQLMGP